MHERSDRRTCICLDRSTNPVHLNPIINGPMPPHEMYQVANQRKTTRSCGVRQLPSQVCLIFLPYQRRILSRQSSLIVPSTCMKNFAPFFLLAMHSHSAPCNSNRRRSVGAQSGESFSGARAFFFSKKKDGSCSLNPFFSFKKRTVRVKGEGGAWVLISPFCEPGGRISRHI